MGTSRTSIRWIFAFFGLVFLLASLGFWQMGKTELAKSFIYPTLVVGALLLAAGIGFVVSNKTRLANFEAQYKADSAAYVQAEIARAEQTIGTYENIAYRVFPAIIIVAALLLIFVQSPMWRGIAMTVMAMMVVLLILDSNANERMKDYRDQLKAVEGVAESN